MPHGIMKKAILLGGVLLIGLVGTAQAKDRVLRPSHPTNRVVIFFHGAGGLAKNLDEKHNPMVPPAVRILLRRGFAVAASDAEGRQNWGDPASVADDLHLIDRLGYERVFFYALSMGGLDAMQLISKVHPEAVAAVAPVCNVSSLGPALTTDIGEIWGESRPSYLSPVVPRAYAGLPVKIWASPEDTWVPAEQNGDVCAAELRGEGAEVTQTATTGQHTNTHMVRPSAVANFFSAIARRNR